MFLGWLIAYVGVVLTGALWYSPLLFGDLWIRPVFKGKPPKDANPAKAFAATLPATAVAVYLLSLLLSVWPAMTLLEAIGRGLLLGGFMFFQQVGHTAFSHKPPLVHLIDSSHDIVCVVVAITALNYFN